MSGRKATGKPFKSRYFVGNDAPPSPRAGSFDPLRVRRGSTFNPMNGGKMPVHNAPDSEDEAKAVELEMPQFNRAGAAGSGSEPNPLFSRTVNGVSRQIEAILVTMGSSAVPVKTTTNARPQVRRGLRQFKGKGASAISRASTMTRSQVESKDIAPAQESAVPSAITNTDLQSLYRQIQPIVERAQRATAVSIAELDGFLNAEAFGENQLDNALAMLQSLQAAQPVLNRLASHLVGALKSNKDDKTSEEEPKKTGLSTCEKTAIATAVAFPIAGGVYAAVDAFGFPCKGAIKKGSDCNPSPTPNVVPTPPANATGNGTSILPVPTPPANTTASVPPSTTNTATASVPPSTTNTATASVPPSTTKTAAPTSPAPSVPPSTTKTATTSVTPTPPPTKTPTSSATGTQTNSATASATATSTPAPTIIPEPVLPACEVTAVSGDVVLAEGDFQFYSKMNVSLPIAPCGNPADNSTFNPVGATVSVRTDTGRISDMSFLQPEACVGPADLLASVGPKGTYRFGELVFSNTPEGRAAFVGLNTTASAAGLCTDRSTHVTDFVFNDGEMELSVTTHSQTSAARRLAKVDGPVVEAGSTKATSIPSDPTADLAAGMVSGLVTVGVTHAAQKAVASTSKKTLLGQCVHAAAACSGAVVTAVAAETINQGFTPSAVATGVAKGLVGTVVGHVASFAAEKALGKGMLSSAATTVALNVATGGSWLRTFASAATAAATSYVLGAPEAPKSATAIAGQRSPEVSKAADLSLA